MSIKFLTEYQDKVIKGLFVLTPRSLPTSKGKWFGNTFIKSLKLSSLKIYKLNRDKKGEKR